ncbi:MAG: response regulator [Gammaproteobacteria bacterium]|jgi:two-component system response regulator PilR (NtrC family)|nr:response regulator [Gammaproteobacteria bacterium]
MTRPLALIVDDEPDICELLGLTLERMEIDTQAAHDLAEARNLLGRHRFHLCLTDMRLPDGDGIDLVRHIQSHHPDLPTAVITAHGNMETAIEALKAGAFDFVSKPIDLQALRDLAGSALRLSDGDARRGSRLTLIGDSAQMDRTRALIAKLARSQAPVYISGESGTGKELAARMIHDLGPRAEGPFIAVNCGAIPAELMESELFGHRKGSFTGAVRDKTGLFQAANGGTLLLDEVGELPLLLQVKLLRAIQEKAVRPVGSEREQRFDARILSATHKDLAKLVADGTFRQDLFYRINVIELPVPPLREHPDDIPQLAGHILERLAGDGITPPVILAADALEALKGYAYPGNVRELENVLERAAALCDAQTIRKGDLGLPDSDPAAAPTQTAAAAVGRRADDAPPPPDDLPLPKYLEAIERQRIVAALEKTRWNRTAAAELLGVSFRTLRYRLKKLEIE